MNVYPFIEAAKAQQRNVKRACQLLEVSRAAYYAQRAGSVSARQRADEQLTQHIRQAITRPRAAMVLHGSTLNFAAVATATPESGWRG